MLFRLEIVYKTKKGIETTLYSDSMSMKSALNIAEDLEKTGRIKQLTLIDDKEGHWTLKQLKKFAEGIQTEPHDIHVYFDGGFDHQTNKAGLGCVIYYTQNEKNYRIRKNALVDELTNSNEAEYAALFLSLQELELLGVHHLPIIFSGDSKVVINQLSDEWPVYENELLKWIKRIEKKQEQLGITATYHQLSRKENREADQLATQALEGIEVESQIELK